MFGMAEHKIIRINANTNIMQIVARCEPLAFGTELWDSEAVQMQDILFVSVRVRMQHLFPSGNKL